MKKMSGVFLIMFGVIITLMIFAYGCNESINVLIFTKLPHLLFGDIESALGETLKIFIQILGFGSAIIALLFNYKRLKEVRTSNEHTARNLDISEKGLVSTRLKDSIQLLSDDKVEIKIGGLISLERLALENEEDRDTVLSILLSFLKQRVTRNKNHPKNSWLDIEYALKILCNPVFNNKGKKIDFPILKDITIQDSTLQCFLFKGIKFENCSFNNCILDQTNFSNCIFDNTTFNYIETKSDIKFEEVEFLGKSRISRSFLNNCLFEDVIFKKSFSFKEVCFFKTRFETLTFEYGFNVRSIHSRNIFLENNFYHIEIQTPIDINNTLFLDNKINTMLCNETSPLRLENTFLHKINISSYIIHGDFISGIKGDIAKGYNINPNFAISQDKGVKEIIEDSFFNEQKREILNMIRKKDFKKLAMYYEKLQE